MLYRDVFLDSIAYERPPRRLTSAEIESRLSPLYGRLGLPEGRLEMMTGIGSRHFWNPGTKPSDAAAMAGEKALAASSLRREDLGCLVMCSVCRDAMEPATATIVHDLLGLSPECLAFDVSNACLGVLTGMILVADMIERGRVTAGMLVAGEDGWPLVEATIEKLLADPDANRNSIKADFASLTIGSAAVAVVLASRSATASGHRLLGERSLIDSRFNSLCRGGLSSGPDGGGRTLMETDSEELMKRGVALAGRTWKEFLAELEWDEGGVDLYCTHQVGKAHKKLLFDEIGADREKDFPVVEEFGNTGSTACPLCLALADETGALAPGDKVAMLGIGSGITCTMMGLQW